MYIILTLFVLFLLNVILKNIQSSYNKLIKKIMNISLNIIKLIKYQGVYKQAMNTSSAIIINVGK